MEKAVIYLRVSTEEQDEETQRAPCNKLCKDRGWKVIDVYKERKSAWGAETLSKREELRRLLKDVRKLKVSHVVVWDLNRLFRNRKKLVETIAAYRAYGVQFHSVRNAWLEELNKIPEPWGEIMTELMLQIVGWMGEDESNLRSENTKRGIARKKKKKEYSGGRPKKRYDYFEAQKLRNDGMSIRKIAKKMKIPRTAIARITHAPYEIVLPSQGLAKGSDVVKIKIIECPKKE